MARSSSRSRIKVDWVLVSLFTFLVLWGWISIYAAVYNEEASKITDLTQEYGKQLLWIGTSVLLLFAVLISNFRLWTNFAPLWYLITMLLLVGVLFLGKKIGGARSWYGLGSFSLQPSELAKFGTAVMLAFYLELPRVNIKRWPDRLIALAIIVLPALLVGLQPDMGSSLVFLSMFLVLYREGMPGYYIGIALALVFLSIIGLIFPFKIVALVLFILAALVVLLLPKKRQFIALTAGALLVANATVFAVGQVMEKALAPHQQVRIKVLLGLEDDPSGAGYNTLQSLIAIGSGGWNGKGFLGGTQTKLNFVPEQSTDYIFCTVGEEWGFFGTALLMSAFALLIGRILYLAEKQKDTFSRVYGYGVGAIFFTHWLINIGMTIGLVPTIGIPLPFFSYGGSSLWGFTILLFIFVKLDAERWNRLS